MIEISTLARNLETTLNANTYGLNYKIFSEIGAFQENLHTRAGVTDYVNGVMSVINSTIVPTQTLCIATLNAQLQLCVQLPNPAQDAQIININRAALDEFFKKSTVQVIADTNGKLYSVAVNYSLANSGTIEQRDIIGSSLNFLVIINYSFIENGLNSLNCSFTLDGILMPYTSASIVRVPVMESNPYNANGNSLNVATSSTLSFDLKIPGTDDGNIVSNIILGYILKGTLNSKHTLIVNLSGVIDTYTVILGQTDIALEGVQNAGHSVSFVEYINLGANDNG